MFEITDLKEKKLQDLQDIAKELNISKYRSLKKLDLVYKILDHQAANPVKTETPQASEVSDNKAVSKERPAPKPRPQKEKIYSKSTDGSDKGRIKRSTYGIFK